MSKIGDFFHGIVAKLPFLEEAAQTAMHDLVPEVEAELKTFVETVVHDFLISKGLLPSPEVGGDTAKAVAGADTQAKQ